MAEVRKEVVVLVGAGGIGRAIARRVATGRKLLLTSLSESEATGIATRLSSEGQGYRLIDINGL